MALLRRKQCSSFLERRREFLCGIFRRGHDRGSLDRVGKCPRPGNGEIENASNAKSLHDVASAITRKHFLPSSRLLNDERQMRAFSATSGLTWHWTLCTCLHSTTVNDCKQLCLLASSESSDSLELFSFYLCDPFRVHEISRMKRPLNVIVT